MSNGTKETRESGYYFVVLPLFETTLGWQTVTLNSSARINRAETRLNALKDLRVDGWRECEKPANVILNEPLTSRLPCYYRRKLEGSGWHMSEYCALYAITR